MDNDRLKLSFRPDYTDTKPAEGNGNIVDKIFQGMPYLYKVKHAPGDTIRCLKHHDVGYVLNTHVYIRLKHHENMRWVKKKVFDGERSYLAW